MLVDGDPLGGGLDVLLGGECAKGLRWPAFADSRGRVGGAALEESLPRLHGVRVLSWDRGESVLIPGEAVQSVLSAARRGGGVVVVDLPRRTDETAAEALLQVDLGIVVVPAELRAVAAAHRVSSRVRLALPDLRVIVRRPGGPSAARPYTPGLEETDIARMLGLPLLGELPWEKGMWEYVERGMPPGCEEGGELARFAREFWKRALSEGGASV